MVTVVKLKKFSVLCFLVVFLGSEGQCPLHLFACGDGSCVDRSRVCNSHRDCKNGADEMECPSRPCSEAFDTSFGTHETLDAFLLDSEPFQCRTGQCVSSQAPCDGVVDCADGSDETTGRCSGKRCGRNEFQCDYGGCIAKRYKCDGNFNCIDGSDETVNACKGKACRRRQFRCGYGACIHERQLCNGKVDCSIDGSDETSTVCAETVCDSATEFQCAYGACIPEYKKCDGVAGCADASDEQGCPGVIFSTPASSMPTEVLTPSSPATTPTPTPTYPPPSVDSGPIASVNLAVNGTCGNSPSLCLCPSPNDHVCAPCDEGGRFDENCNNIGKKASCQLPLFVPGITVDILSCGPESGVLFGTFQGEKTRCGSVFGVPTLTVVLCECMSTQVTLTLQCYGDGLWHGYPPGTDGGKALGMRDLCQFGSINSPVCGITPTYERRGAESTININRLQKPLPKWAWLVGLLIQQEFACTGVLISPAFVLTAAHCVTRSREAVREVLDVREVKIQHLLTHEEFRYDSTFVSAIYVHPGYSGQQSLDNDLALVKIETPIVFSRFIFPVCLDDEAPNVMQRGSTFNRGLRRNKYGWKMHIHQLDLSCHYPSYRPCNTSLSLSERQFCTRDSSEAFVLEPGSSGGPFVINKSSGKGHKWTVSGVVSYTPNSHATCKIRDTVLTGLPAYLPWIRQCVTAGICA